MFSDEDLLPLSALQHFIFCPRQCALIHVEQQWAENRFTAEGNAQHSRVDRPEQETRDGVRTEYAVLIRSLRLGLIGKADAVEFHGIQPHFKSEISYLNSPPDKMPCIYPVEHKRGRPKPTHCDLVQLCAQALCLEEMLGVAIPEGALFYGQPRRRLSVAFSPELRAETEGAVAQLHALVRSGKTPAAEYEGKKCGACSLLEICMPQPHRPVSSYLADTAFEISDLKFDISQREP